MIMGTGPNSLRTHPTVKQSVAMNMKGLRKWEVKFGLVQTFILVGLVTGSMAGAFYFGFYSGQDAGYERAYSSGLGNAPRIPIAVSELPPSASQDAVSEVYARLHDNVAKPGAGAANAAVGGEELAAIAQSEAVDSPIDVEAGALTDPIDEESLGQIESQPIVPGGASKAVDSAAPTLGNVIDGRAAVAIKPDDSAKSTGSAGKASLKSLAPAVIAPNNETQQQKVTVKERVEPVAKVQAAEKAVVEKPTNDKNLVRSILPKGWFAQVAAPRKRADAEVIAKRLKSSGFGVMIESANVRGQEYFRVVVGPEQSRTQVDRLVTQLKRETYIEGEPFPRLVK